MRYPIRPLSTLALLLAAGTLSTGCGGGGGDQDAAGKPAPPGADVEKTEAAKPIKAETPGADVEKTEAEKVTRAEPPAPAPKPEPATPPGASLPGEPVGGPLTQLPSGLEYYDFVVGDGDTPPGLTRAVVVHYDGYLLNGTKFDSSHNRGYPSGFLLGGVIRGWTEGLASMRVGGKRKLVIPAALGYGARGIPGTIPPDSMLVFDVELLPALDVSIPETLPGEPVTGEPQVTFAGVRYWVMEEGSGGTAPTVQTLVRLHYTGWLTDGTMFDSSIEKGTPIMLPLGRFITGWSDAVGMMKPGERRKILVPWQLGYGTRGSGQKIPPKADLIFDVELIDVIDQSK